MLFKLLIFIFVNNINAFNYYNAFNRRTILKTTSGILFSNNINLNENYIDEIDDNIIDGYLIALKEFEQKKVPFIIKRPLPNGGCEYWKLPDLEILI